MSGRFKQCSRLREKRVEEFYLFLFFQYCPLGEKVEGFYQNDPNSCKYDS